MGFVRRECQQLREHRLVLLLLLTCAAVAYVVTQQADTVDQQRILIRILGDDSQQLHSSRLRDQMQRRAKPRPDQPDSASKSPQATPDAGKPGIGSRPRSDEQPAPRQKEPLGRGPRLVRGI